MKHILPTFLSAGLICLLLGSAALGQGFTPIDVGAQEKQPTPSTAASTDGQKLVAEAARRVFDEAAIAADLRYKIDAFGHELVGTGRYLQLGAGAGKLLRLELKMQVADQPATLQEICGPQYYYVRRDVPPGEPTLGRVDLHQFRNMLAARLDQPRQIMPSDGWIMLGGLPRLLASLEQNFQFAAAEPQNLEFNAGDGQVQRLPIWVVEGAWKPQRLAAASGRDADELKPGQLPEQLPDRVRLVLGRTTGVLPLFPYRVTYLRLPKAAGAAPPAGAATAKAEPPHEMLTLELFNVHRKGDIDPREFDYNPAGQKLEVQDLTTAYLQRYGEQRR
jgi:hypothetical protein